MNTVAYVLCEMPLLGTLLKQNDMVEDWFPHFNIDLKSKSSTAITYVLLGLVTFMLIIIDVMGADCRQTVQKVKRLY